MQEITITKGAKHMSWHVSYDSKQGFENDQPVSAGGVDVTDQDQYEAAREQAAALIASGCVGDDTRDFRVSLSGHTNPEHAPRSGWANDTVTVTVTQK